MKNTVQRDADANSKPAGDTTPDVDANSKPAGENSFLRPLRESGRSVSYFSALDKLAVDVEAGSDSAEC